MPFSPFFVDTCCDSQSTASVVQWFCSTDRYFKLTPSYVSFIFTWKIDIDGARCQKLATVQLLHTTIIDPSSTFLSNPLLQPYIRFALPLSRFQIAQVTSLPIVLLSTVSFLNRILGFFFSCNIDGFILCHPKVTSTDSPSSIRTPVFMPIFEELSCLFNNLWRTTSDLERLEKMIYHSIRLAADVHRQSMEYLFLLLFLNMQSIFSSHSPSLTLKTEERSMAIFICERYGRDNGNRIIEGGH
uniref:Uncharacterized protein n=1 Tax=Lactuca sativa TaxID=4236 RepID=A0A9R1UHP5_LACSA|nr:hypothetical protein LSAT_V11C900461320 [Lactuca sativa]